MVIVFFENKFITVIPLLSLLIFQLVIKGGSKKKSRSNAEPITIEASIPK